MTLRTNHVINDTGHTDDHNAIATQVNQNTADVAANKGLPVGATGATQPTRYVGRWSTAGAPVTGTFAVGDFGFDSLNTVQICTVAGSPGTFVPSAASGVPVGGTTGQGLTKKTNADNDTQWSNLAQISSATPLANSAAGGAGSTGQASDAGHYHPAISIATQGIAQFMQSGRYYSFIGGGGTPGGVAQGTGECRLVPIWVDTNITVSSLSIEVTSSGVSAKQRLGIYGTTNGLPGTLLLDAGQADASTTGFKEITGLSLALTPGLYWLAQAAQGAVNSIRMITNGYTAGVAPTTLTTQPSAYRNDTITAALPGTFTLGTTPVASEGPRIWLKVA